MQWEGSLGSIRSHLESHLTPGLWKSDDDFRSNLMVVPFVSGWFILWWMVRKHEDPTKQIDLWLFIGFCLFRDLRNSVSRQVVVTQGAGIGLGLIASAAFASLVILALHGLSQFPRSTRSKTWKPVGCDQPLILRCRTTHSRFFPKAHSFSYSYLQVSIPVAFNGNCGRILSVGSAHKWSLFNVTPSDYLERHCQFDTLAERLNSYLQSQGVAKDQWSRAYLVTAPRFLGYSFNPVSFWYLYDAADRLTMMVLEVNNTFDERRMYLLNNDVEEKRVKLPDVKFKHNWGKDFHVSPFNSRKGAYSLTALDAFQTRQLAFPGIDNTIVLTSSKKHSKLVARLHSERAPLEAGRMSFFQLISLSTNWGLVGFFTFPRILKEAFLLFFRRKLRVWLRPEVTFKSVGRSATEVERYLESILDKYLQHMADTCSDDIEVRYSPRFRPASTVHTGGFESGTLKLDINVLSPEFYSRLVHYESLEAALQHEGAAAPEKCQTVRVSSHVTLQLLLRGEKISLQPLEFNAIEKLRWHLVKYLRQAPAPLAYSKDASAIPVPQQCGLSSLDRFAMTSCGDSWRYRRILTRLFLARRISFGLVGLIDLLDLAIRISMLALANDSLPLQYGVHAYAMLKGTG